MGGEWAEAMALWFRLIELRLRFGAILATPAIEIKQKVLTDIIKEYKSLEESRRR